MVPHANTVVAFAEQHHQDLRAASERERRAAADAPPALPWRALAVRAVAVAAVFLGLRG
jgi:hypothetical protein